MTADRRPVSLREAVGAFALLLLLATAIFFPFVVGDRTLENGAGTADSLYPSGAQYPDPIHIAYQREVDPFAGALFTEPILALEHNEIMRDATLPLWNPYSGFGMPLLANMQSQPFSPFAAIPILRSTGRGYDAFVAFRLLAGAFLAFLYLRRFTSFLPAMAGGVAYFLSGYFWLFLSLPETSAEVLTPGLLLGTELVLWAPRPRNAAILGILCGVSVLGGMPESSALALIFVTLYAAARLAFTRIAIREKLVYLAGAGMLGIALSAIAVLPFASYADESSNSHRPGDAASVIDSKLFESASIDAIAQYAAPLVAGLPHFGGIKTGPPLADFFGAATLFFAALAVFGACGDLVRRRPRDPAPIFFFASVAIVLVARRFGIAPARFLGQLPVLRLIVLSKYEEAIVACCVCALAAFGIERLRTRRVCVAEMLPAFVIPLIFFAVVARTPNPFGPSHEGLRTFAIAGAAAFLTIAAAIAFIAVRGPRLGSRFIAGAALATVVLEIPLLFIVPLYDVLNPNPPTTLSPLRGAPYISFLQDHLATGERFWGEDVLLTPDWSAAFSIDDVRALDAIFPARYLRFVRAFLRSPDHTELLYYFVGRGRYDLNPPLVRRFLALSGIRYVGFAKVRGPIPSSAIVGLRPAFTDAGALLYEVPAPFPRVALYRHAIVARDGDAALAAMVKPEFDPWHSAVVEASIPAALRNGPAAAVTRGRIERYAPSDVVVDATATGPTLLVLSDTNFDGWTATVDGNATPILAANYLFRGVVIGPGTHRIEFHYLPNAFTIGALVSLAALAMLLAALVFDRGVALQRRNIAHGSST